jgi:hypothetical protein
MSFSLAGTRRACQRLYIYNATEVIIVSQEGGSRQTPSLALQAEAGLSWVDDTGCFVGGISIC